jgi:phenylalanine-4-hydroxylase
MSDLTMTQKHGLAGGYVPERPDWVIPQNWNHYTPSDHAVWRHLYERQIKLLKGRACQAFIEGLNTLPLGAKSIPNFDVLNEVLFKRTGWTLVAVHGLVPDEVFFEHLANRRFPAGQFIRKPDQLDYLQEPDVFHDIFGHVPMMLNPVMADYIQAYGQGGLRALKLGCLHNLTRLYWYTVEFGLVEDAGDLRIFGAGIVSSLTETRFALESPSPNRIGFDLKRVMRTPYRIDDFQESYFVLPSMDTLLSLAELDFGPIYDEIGGLEDLSISRLEATDRVFTQGSGDYHVKRL